MKVEIKNSNGYKIDIWGNVYDEKNNIRKVYTDSFGYVTVNIPDLGNVSIHRLLAIAFIPITSNENINDLEVNHLDKNPSNNSLENLEWVTRIQNNHHSELFSEFGSRLKLLSINVITNELNLWRNVFTAEEKLNINIYKIWNSVKNNEVIDDYLFRYFPRGERIPDTLKKKCITKPIWNVKIPVKILNIDDNSILEFESKMAAAKHFNTGTNHIFISMSTPHTLRLFKRKYVIVEKDQNFPVIDDDRVLQIMSSTGKPLVVYNKITNNMTVYETLRDFCNKTNRNYKNTSRALRNAYVNNDGLLATVDLLCCYHSKDTSMILKEAISKL